MLLRILLFGAYAISYALILGSNMLSRGDCATTDVLLYGRFRLIYSVRMLLYTEKCFETTRYRIKIGLCFG